MYRDFECINVKMTCTFAQSDGTVLNTITFILAALCFTHTYIQKTLIQTSYPIPPDCLNFPNTCCICVNNSHVETVCGVHAILASATP